MIHSYFYPRSPCGERLAEVDGEDTSSGDFYPRSPCGERPTITGIIYSDRKISIHALLAESDDLHRGEMVLTARISIHALLAESDSPKVLKVKRTTADFYPRSPCGERLYANFDGFYWWVISIHALLAESDLFLCCNAAKPRHFYPRSPCGERQVVVPAPAVMVPISIHALLAESDLCR